MSALKIARLSMIAGLLVAGVNISTPVFAQADALSECLAQCRASARMITDPAWSSQYAQMCTANCIAQYDGGYGNPPPGTGTTPIGGCSYGSCYYDPR